MHGQQISKIRLKKLVQLLTSFRSFQVSDITLYTFKHYTTPVQLLKLLIQRFAMPLPRNLSQSQAKFFMLKNFVVVQAKVLNFIAEWLDKRKQDFQEDSFLYQLLKAFLQQISEVPAIFGLHKLIFKQKLYPLLDRIEDEESLAEEFSMHNFTPNAYPRLCHISPHFFRKGDFILLYDSEVIAGQLCLVDSSRLRQIDTDQFLNRSWEKQTNAPNIRNFNRYNEAVTRWYELVIILQPSSLARSKMISKLLLVCQHLWKYHNFNSLLNIYTAISLRVEDHLPISMELALRNRNAALTFGRLKRLYRSDKQFCNAWLEIQKSSLPCLPSFMLWGKRMESIYSKAEVLKRFEIEGMINFDTQRDICKALKMLKDYQGAYYKFYRVALLYEFFKNDYYRQLSQFCLDLESNQHATKISLDLLKQASLSEHP